MTTLEKMKKQREIYNNKIKKIENDLAKLRNVGWNDNDFIVKSNLKWLKRAKEYLSNFDNRIKLEEMKQV